MTEAIEQAGSEGSASQEATAIETGRSWGRTHTIWLLITMSFVPGVIVALFREEWTALPPHLRAVAYFLSGVLIVAACSLIFVGSEQRDS